MATLEDMCDQEEFLWQIEITRMSREVEAV